MPCGASAESAHQRYGELRLAALHAFSLHAFSLLIHLYLHGSQFEAYLEDCSDEGRVTFYVRKRFRDRLVLLSFLVRVGCLGSPWILYVR